MLCLGFMTDERLILAIGRIERALSRLEARGNAAPAPQNDRVLGELRREHDALEERHRKLRARTNEAVDRLTSLLETPRVG